MYSLALDKVMEMQWTIPEYCISYVSLYNSGCDRENGVKVLNDSLQGVLYMFDSRILDGPIRRVKDFKGPRISVTIIELTEDLWGLYRQKGKKSPEPMPHAEWMMRQVNALYGDRLRV